MRKEFLKKLPATFLDEEKIACFAVEMVRGVNKGKKTYPESYTFDPLEEIKEECIDGANYFMIMYYRVKQLQEKINGMVSKESKTRRRRKDS